MKAIFQAGYGAPEVMKLVDRERPTMNASEILVRNFASTVSAADQAFRSGNPFIARLFSGVLRPKNPYVGDMFAGIIETIGADVDNFSVGDRVWGHARGASDQNQGTLAEYVSVSTQGALSKMPDDMSYEQAAAILDGGLTAISFLQDHYEMVAGQKILINGASGSIGTIAVQLAKAAGMDVTAVSSARNHKLLMSLGADEVIDYQNDDFAQNLDTYDVVFDAIGKRSFGDVRPALKAQGAYLTTVPSWSILWTMLRTRKKIGKWGKLATTGLRPASDKAKDMRTMAQMFEKGLLKPVVGNSFLLKNTVQAHHLLDTGHKVGAAVITISV